MLFVSLSNLTVKRLCMRLFAVSFVVHILSAWFNEGFHQFDEHFQVIEFASYKRGVTPVTALPWEFPARIRPAMQPAIAFAVFEAMDSAGVFQPFRAMFILRLISALFGWATAVIITLYALRWLKQERSQRLLIWLSALFWCAPYLHARFSSESWSAMALFLGVITVLYGSESSPAHQGLRRWCIMAAGGLLLGFSFEMRFQSAIAVAGFIAWLGAYKRHWRESMAILGGIACMLGVGAVLDAWLYGAYVFPPWNYVNVNLMQGMAATFGVEPWWWYFTTFALWLAVPPLGIIALIGLGWACCRYWRNPFVWVFVPFVAVHCLIGHKEERFLFPMIFAVPVLLALAVEGILSNDSSPWQRWAQSALEQRWLRITVIVLNGILLAVMTIKPASTQIPIYEYCYDSAARSAAPLVVYSLDGSPYQFDNAIKTLPPMEIMFYQPINFRVESVTEKELRTALAQAQQTNQSLLFFHKSKPPSVLSDTNIVETVVASSFPTWTRFVNINHWMERSNVWMIYECRLKQ